MPSFSGFVATGTNFADALSGSVVAAMNSRPIILTPPTGIQYEMIEGLKNLEIVDYMILGGPVAVNEKVEKDLWDIMGMMNFF
jgi:putative cell wall-binding protein